jgi:hypothetical protein
MTRVTKACLKRNVCRPRFNYPRGRRLLRLCRGRLQRFLAFVVLSQELLLLLIKLRLCSINVQVDGFDQGLERRIILLRPQITCYEKAELGTVEIRGEVMKKVRFDGFPLVLIKRVPEKKARNDTQRDEPVAEVNCK